MAFFLLIDQVACDVDQYHLSVVFGYLSVVLVVFQSQYDRLSCCATVVGFLLSQMALVQVRFKQLCILLLQEKVQHSKFTRAFMYAYMHNITIRAAAR